MRHPHPIPGHLGHGGHPPRLETARLHRLRPTQWTVGLAEVDLKRAEWRGLRHRERESRMRSHTFPGVRGPDGRLHIVDHHHLGLALWQEGIEQVPVVVIDDLDDLDPPTFLAVMEHRRWLHPFDAQGRRCDPATVPRRLDALADDPYRSLAAAVRRAGGCAKDAEPYAEFLWADHLRRRIDPGALTRSPDEPVVGPAVLAAAIALAHDPMARYLPGWTGHPPAPG